MKCFYFVSSNSWYIYKKSKQPIKNIYNIYNIYFIIII